MQERCTFMHKMGREGEGSRLLSGGGATLLRK